MTDTESTSRRTVLILGSVLAITLLLKVLLVVYHGSSYQYQSDDREYIRSAQLWLETGVFTYNDPERPTVFITPAYPGFIALIMMITGPGLLLEQMIRIIQVIMVTASLYLLFILGRRIVGEKAALWGTCLAAFYPPLWLISNMIFTESLFILALMLLCLAAFRAEAKPGWPSALLFGIVWAVTVYIRPTIALWPGLFFIMLLWRKQIPWKRLVQCGLVSGLVFCLCLSPWWVRNYEVSGGQFIPLTKSGGNPLLLGTFPYTVPALFMEEQRTWHSTDNLWINDQQDTEMAKERIKAGFKESFWLYLSWYTVGKFALFWGDVFYWMPLPGIPLVLPILYHYLLLGLGAVGLYRLRSQANARVILVLLGYMSLLHMIYLAHSRYSLPLMPFIALFAGSVIHQWLVQRRDTDTKRLRTPKKPT